MTHPGPDTHDRSCYFIPVGKGEQTRDAILDQAIQLGSQLGIEGLSIGRLAEALDLSKSGLFAHFDSKEALQLETLNRAAERFAEVVVRPALAEPRGEPRVRALFERWLRWPQAVPQPGGCIFIAAAAELDDRPGPVRDRLAELQRQWLGTIAAAVRRAKAEGHFRRAVDPDQFAFELLGITFAFHHASRLLRESNAPARARAAFERLLATSRST
jgi:AcrR family transcriptional regulator